MSENQQAKRVALLTGAAQGIGAATARLFAERGYSVAALDVLDTASVSGHVGQTGHVIYGASKGALLSFTRALAWEVAGDNIRVNSLSPGSVDTPMLRSDVTLESQRTGRSFAEVKRLREAEQAFKRWADPREIAEAIFFLASNAASFMTGSDLLVDCGWVAK
jgi:NAD(P)-dependent dehydrogenase (short-subunit alcohol dehydrogenase family)